MLTGCLACSGHNSQAAVVTGARIRLILVGFFISVMQISTVSAQDPAPKAKGGVLSTKDRIKKKHLEATRASIEHYRQLRLEKPRSGPYREYRANLHVHSYFSHDSRGTVEQIVKAAKSVGTDAILFTEHPAEHYDFVTEGHQGLRDGVLLIPGAEMKGMLVYPRQSVRGFDLEESQQFSDVVRTRGGMTFLSHLEERMDWEIRGITGVEIYNTHADFKEKKEVLELLKNPLWLAQTSALQAEYPQEFFAALNDYPQSYLKRYDELCQRARHTGVSANDAHQNVGIRFRQLENDVVQVEDALEEKLVTLNGALVRTVLGKKETTRVGEVLHEILLDRYEQSLTHVATHILADSLDEKSLREGLEEGRAFVGFDWIADSRGFDFQLHGVSETGEKWTRSMGSEERFSSGMELTGQASLPGHWRVIRNGLAIHEHDGDSLRIAVKEPGVYRAEVWLSVAGEERIWILSNPFYIR